MNKLCLIVLGVLLSLNSGGLTMEETQGMVYVGSDVSGTKDIPIYSDYYIRKDCLNDKNCFKLMPMENKSSGESK